MSVKNIARFRMSALHAAQHHHLQSMSKVEKNFGAKCSQRVNFEQKVIHQSSRKNLYLKADF